MTALSDFLIMTGRTLSQMALYSADHPAVQDNISKSHQLLSNALTNETEITLSLAEGKLVINGKVPENLPAGSTRPFIHVLEKFDLHSLTFYPGVEPQEMIPFFKLAGRMDPAKMGMSLPEFLAGQDVTRIRVNQSKYTKIREDQTVGGDEGEKESRPFLDQVKDLSLPDLIRQMVSRIVKDPADQERVFKYVMDLIKNNLEGAIRKATENLNKEKTRISNELGRTEGVISNMADGVVVVDEGGRVLMMNPVAETLYGVKLGECVGKPLWEQTSGEKMVALAKDLSVPTDRPVVKEVQIQADQKTQRTLRGSSATVQDVNGRIVGMVSVLSDVTKQKELNRMQTEFMANVTHELRTPIHSMKLALGAILEGSAGDVSNEQGKMLGMATRNLERLSRLIDDLLDFSKLQAGKMEIHPQVIDAGSVCKEAVEGVSAWASSRNIKVSVEDVEDLPLVYADTDRILQVIINLLSNAIKFTPEGGSITVRAKALREEKKSFVHIEVQDTGKGISKEDQDRIFDKFVQLKGNLKSDVRGTGLGLSICQAIIKLHKGEMSVESPPLLGGEGTIFSFTLPAVENAPGMPPLPKDVAAAPDPKAHPRKKFWKTIMSIFRVVAVGLVLLPAVAQARPKWGTVRRVLSGDMIQLRDGSKVRYLGVDAPLMGTPFYVNAVSANRRLVENKEVRLVYGLQERDTEGNWLAYVFADGYFVNEELVRGGFALVSPLANEEEFLNDLLAAEKKAQLKNRGVWAEMDIEPYTVRKQKQSGFPWATLEDIQKGHMK